MSDLTTVDVSLGDRSYPVLVGDRVRHEIPAVLDDVFDTPPKRIAIVTQRSNPFAPQHPRPDNAAFDTAALDTTMWRDLESPPTNIAVRTFNITEGESAKQLGEVQDLCSGFAEFGLTRNDVVVAIGGGVVTDVAGFAASVYHRGMAVIHIPTTLLGQIDAAIGGKTGVNLPEGKNLVGTFWQPKAVLCDTETLTTLPKRELLSGFGEMAKYHFLGTKNLGAKNLDQPPTFPVKGQQVTEDMTERIAECVRIKAEFISADETESPTARTESPAERAGAPKNSHKGGRALLNYGHTLAHALETSGKFDLRHGEAVAVGLHYAALLARRMGRITDDGVEEHRRVLSCYDLSYKLPADANHDELIKLFGSDKKATNGFTFVLASKDGLEVVPEVPETILRETLAELAAVS